MQIPIKWINEVIDSEILELENLIEKLTFGGFEVEKVLEIDIENQKEIILDISATANRSDSLSIQGISNEIGALLNKSFKISNYLTKAINWKLVLKNLTYTPFEDKNCSIFLAIEVKNLKNIEVPKWVKKPLLSSGISSQNNLIDFQNYILLETGYPFVLYDMDKISNQLNHSTFSLSISNIRTKKKILASNRKMYDLDNSILTVNANKLPISIAGLIETKDSMYSNNTNTVLIEGSLFNSAIIRQQSRKLGLRTDRSARYEKSLQKTHLIEAFYRLISLLRLSNPMLVCKLHTIKKMSKHFSNSIILKYKTINEILGPITNVTNSMISYLTIKKINNYLSRLNFHSTYNKVTQTWQVQIPTMRSSDIKREIDLIEEIGRLHGFNNFVINLPKIKKIGIKNKTYKKITKCLLSLGLNELIHSSLVNQETFLENKVKLFNPLSADYSNLRKSLLPNLLKTVQENLKQTNTYLNGFEYGHIFQKNLENNFEEQEYISGIFGGNTIKLSWSQTSNKMDWFEAKGKIKQLFNQLNLNDYWKLSKSQKTATILHPYRSAEIYLLDNKRKIGNFGQIHPFVATELNLSSSLYLFEFNVQTIKEGIKIKKLSLYNQYPIYPKIIKNMSFIIDKDISFQKIREIIYANGTILLLKIVLLDEYTSQALPDNSISLCLELSFQSTASTLKNKKIEHILKNIEMILKKKFNVTIRT